MQSDIWKFNLKEKVLLVVASGLFIFLVLMLCFYNRFSADDYYSVSVLRTHSIFQYAAMIYQEWNIRLLPQLFASLIIKYSTLPFIFFVYGMASLFFLIFSIRLFLKNLFIVYLNHKPEPIILFSYSVLITIFFFFTTFRIDETWFWLSSSVTYLWGNSMLIAGSAIVISDSKSVKSILFLCFCFLYTGSSSEPLAFATIIVLINLLICCALKFKFIKQLIINKNIYYKIYFGLFACLIGFLFNYLSPGRPLREALFQHPNLLNGIAITLKTMAKIVIDFFPHKILYLLLLSFSFIYLGFTSSRNINNKKYLRAFSKSFFRSLLVLFALLFISIFPMAYLMQDVAINRTLSHVSFIIMVFAVYWLLRIGLEARLNKNLLQKLFSISLDVLIIVLAISIYSQYKTVPVYANAMDKRINYLKKLNNKGEISHIELEPLPSSGLLHSAEISTDSTYEQNKHFKNGLSLNFSISVKK